MKLRLCDGCGLEIKAKEKFIKCCESYIEDKYQKLNHIGDLCIPCWNKIEKKGARPRTIPKNEEERQERIRLMEESHKSAAKYMKEKNRK